jgi:hypothetical protein
MNQLTKNKQNGERKHENAPTTTEMNITGTLPLDKLSIFSLEALSDVQTRVSGGQDARVQASRFSRETSSGSERACCFNKETKSKVY